jgi:hypothetical protein
VEAVALTVDTYALRLGPYQLLFDCAPPRWFVPEPRRWLLRLNDASVFSCDMLTGEIYYNRNALLVDLLPALAYLAFALPTIKALLLAITLVALDTQGDDWRALKEQHRQLAELTPPSSIGLLSALRTSARPLFSHVATPLVLP